MRKTLGVSLVLSLVSLLIWSCSPAAPTEVGTVVTELSTVQIAIGTILGPSGVTAQHLFANINDGTRIKGGGVTVNGTPLIYGLDPMAPGYDRTDVPVAARTAYQFIITISGGAKCTASVVTPAAFGTVSLPASFKIGRGDTVTWTDVAQGTMLDVRLIASNGQLIFNAAGAADSGRIIITPSDTTLVGTATLAMQRRTTGQFSTSLPISYPSASNITAGFGYEAVVSLVR